MSDRSVSINALRVPRGTEDRDSINYSLQAVAFDADTTKSVGNSDGRISISEIDRHIEAEKASGDPVSSHRIEVADQIRDIIVNHKEASRLEVLRDDLDVFVFNLKNIGGYGG